MANLCKYVSVLCVLIFLKSSSHVLGEITAEAVYETLSFSIFKMKTDMENLKRRFKNMEEMGQRISTTSSPQSAGRPLKEKEMLDFKEYFSLQALAIKKALAAEKLVLRETVESFEVKFAEFKSEIQKDIASISSQPEDQVEAMTDIVNRRSSALEKDMAELTKDLNYKTSNIRLFIESIESTMMSNFGDIWTHIENLTMMQKRDGTWNEWGSWSECSSTCGYGMERRQRNCSDVAGHRCYGETTEYRICKMVVCQDIVESNVQQALTVLANKLRQLQSQQMDAPSSCSQSCGADNDCFNRCVRLLYSRRI